MKWGVFRNIGTRLHLLTGIFDFHVILREVEDKYTKLYEADKKMDLKEEQLANLVKKLTEKEQLISTKGLTADDDDANKINSKNLKLQDFDELTRDLENKQKELENLSEELSLKSAQLRSIESETLDAKLNNITELEKLSQELDGITSRVNVKKSELFTLEQDCKEKHSLITNQTEEVLGLESKIWASRKELEVVESALKEHKHLAEEQKEKARCTDSDLRLKSSELQRITANVDFKSAELIALETDIQEKRKDFESMSKGLDDSLHTELLCVKDEILVESAAIPNDQKDAKDAEHLRARCS